MFEVIRKELRANAKALAVWALVMAFFMGVGTMKFSGAESVTDAGNMQELLAKFPRIVLAVFGMGDAGAIDISTFPGFYAVLWFYAAVIEIAAAVSFGRSAVTREIADGTCEFLFVRPVSRARVLGAKLAAAAVETAVLALACWVGSVAAYPALGLDADPGALFARAALGLLGLGLVFLCAGAACAAVARHVERGALAGNCLVLAAYLMSVAYDMFSDKGAGDVLRVLSPIRWWLPRQLVKGTLDAGFIALGVGVAAACLAITFAAFSRRDLVER